MKACQKSLDFNGVSWGVQRPLQRSKRVSDRFECVSEVYFFLKVSGGFKEVLDGFQRLFHKPRRFAETLLEVPGNFNMIFVSGDFRDLGVLSV